MKRFLISAFSFLVCASSGLAWSGDSWGQMSRTDIEAIADQMIDSSWTPHSTFTNFMYVDSGTGQNRYHTYYSGSTYYAIPYSEESSPQDSWSEFASYMAVTSGGTKTYGNDCSG